MMRLRVHHLLCSALYVGKGYSREFCENMQQVVQWLWEPSAGQEKEEKLHEAANGSKASAYDGEARQVELIAEPDNICLACPNLSEQGCKLDDNHVVSKDEALAQALGLKTGHIYAVSELLRIVEKNLTAEIFESSCHNCEWYGQGLCHYDALVRKYHNSI